MFQVLFDNKLIGKSILEDGDPPMGCSGGLFIPQDHFAQFQSGVLPEPDDNPALRRWIGYPLYEELFPGRHAAYVAGFTK